LLFIYLPLIDDQGKEVEKLVRLRKRAPKHLPRIGESVYVLPKTSLKVQDVKYSGVNWQFIAITLEPISASRKAELESVPYLKGSDRWEVSHSRFDYENEA